MWLTKGWGQERVSRSEAKTSKQCLIKKLFRGRCFLLDKICLDIMCCGGGGGRLFQKQEPQTKRPIATAFPRKTFDWFRFPPKSAPVGCRDDAAQAASHACTWDPARSHNLWHQTRGETWLNDVVVACFVPRRHASVMLAAAWWWFNCLTSSRLWGLRCCLETSCITFLNVSIFYSILWCLLA